VARHWAERRARDHLEAQGYTLLAENYARPGGEIDLVMEQGGVTVFVEVRQRGSARFGSAAESLTPAKLARLRRTALAFLVERHGHDDVPVRFDAVLVSGRESDWRLEHLQDIR
jgi:putative endonuclease